jgi:hypothetical protein
MTSHFRFWSFRLHRVINAVIARSLALCPARDVRAWKKNRRMIARIWRGWTKRTDAKTYDNMLCNEIFPSIVARNIKGYRGAELFIREDDDETEFVTLLRFDSMDAVKEFAGADETKPVIFPGAENSLHKWSRRDITESRTRENCRPDSSACRPFDTRRESVRGCPTTDVGDVGWYGTRFKATGIVGG